MYFLTTYNPSDIKASRLFSFQRKACTDIISIVYISFLKNNKNLSITICLGHKRTETPSAAGQTVLRRGRGRDCAAVRIPGVVLTGNKVFLTIIRRIKRVSPDFKSDSMPPRPETTR